MIGNFGRAAAAAIFLVAVVSRTSRAVERDFSLVTSQSSIAASGTVTTALGTATIQPQGTGSLTTTYGGIIKTDREASSISFLSGSSIAANVNGSWNPDSTAAD